MIDRTGLGCLVTGSIRAFREIALQHGGNQLVNDMLLVSGTARLPISLKASLTAGGLLPPDR